MYQFFFETLTILWIDSSVTQGLEYLIGVELLIWVHINHSTGLINIIMQSMMEGRDGIDKEQWHPG